MGIGCTGSRVVQFLVFGALRGACGSLLHIMNSAFRVLRAREIPENFIRFIIPSTDLPGCDSLFWHIDG